MDHTYAYDYIVGVMESNTTAGGRLDGYDERAFNDLADWEKEELEERIWEAYCNDLDPALYAFLPYLKKHDGIGELRERLEAIRRVEEGAVTRSQRMRGRSRAQRTKAELADVLYRATGDRYYFDIMKECCVEESGMSRVASCLRYYPKDEETEALLEEIVMKSEVGGTRIMAASGIVRQCGKGTIPLHQPDDPYGTMEAGKAEDLDLIRSLSTNDREERRSVLTEFLGREPSTGLIPDDLPHKTMNSTIKRLILAIAVVLGILLVSMNLSSCHYSPPEGYTEEHHTYEEAVEYAQSLDADATVSEAAEEAEQESREYRLWPAEIEGVSCSIASISASVYNDGFVGAGEFAKTFYRLDTDYDYFVAKSLLEEYPDGYRLGDSYNDRFNQHDVVVVNVNSDNMTEDQLKRMWKDYKVLSEEYKKHPVHKELWLCINCGDTREYLTKVSDEEFRKVRDAFFSDKQTAE